MNIEDNEYVKQCGKLTKYDKYKEKLCDWSGALVDYVYHVEKDHPQSFHRLKSRKIEYSWTADVQDKMEIAILTFQRNSFLYKICFERESKFVSHEIQPIDPEKNMLIEVCDSFYGPNEFVRTPCRIKHQEGNYRSIQWTIKFSDVLID